MSIKGKCRIMIDIHRNTHAFNQLNIIVPFHVPLLNMNVIQCAEGVILIKNMGGTRICKYIT